MAQGFLLVGQTDMSSWEYVVREGLALELDPAGKGVYWKGLPHSKPLVEQAHAF